MTYRPVQRKALIGGCLGSLLLWAVALAVPPWIIMLTLGVVHRELAPGVPALGWFSVLLIWLSCGIVVGLLSRLFKRG